MSLIRGWTTVYNLDLAAEGTSNPQTLSSDTTYTIAGKTWTKFNSSNDGTALGIGSTGVVITPTTSADYWTGPTRISPGIHCTFSQLVPNWTVDMPTRAWAYVSSYNGGTNYDNAILAIDNQANTCMCALKRGNGTAGVGVQSFVLTSGGAVYGPASNGLTIGASNNVMVMEMPSGAKGGIINTYIGAYSSGWPTTLTPMATINAALFNSSYASSVGVVLSASRAGGTAGLVVKFANLRIDAKIAK